MQSLKIYLLAIPAMLSSCLIGCKSPDAHLESNLEFTKADSLTEKFLDLEDSILAVWNKIVKEDNLKIRMMHNLVHELLVANQLDKEMVFSLEDRLNQLSEMKITQESIKNPVQIKEFDSASYTLVSELITLAKSQEIFTRDRGIQKIVDAIQETNLRVEQNRNNYDQLADEFNQFIERNEKFLTETDQNLTMQKKPFFK